MHKKTNEFLESICANIKYKPIHQDIRDELTLHLDELKQEFMKETHNEEIALDMAISAMGDCNEIGSQLNKLHRPQTEWSLVGLTAVISIIGAIVMYTSSLFEPHMAVNFQRYLLYAPLGIAVIVGLYFFDYTKLKKFAWPIYILTFTFLVARLIFIDSVGGLMIFILDGYFYSTEFTTLLFLVAFAGFVDKTCGKGNIGILKLSAIAALSVLPILQQPRLSQAITLLIGYSVLIIAAVAKNHFGSNKKQQFALLGVLAMLCGFIIIVFSANAYRAERVLNFLSRGQSDPLGYGYQHIMADRLLAASSLFGKTTETINGREMYLYMPSLTTDFILINVFVTFGSLMGIALILIIAYYIGKMFVAAKKIKYSYGFYLSFAACTVLTAQFVMGILVNFNLFPITSVYFPFISYGGVGYVTSMALIGLVLSVWRRNNLCF